MSEAELNNWQNGDRSAFKSLYNSYGSALYGVAFKILKDDALAKDVVQESFVKIWKNRASYDSEKSRVFTWMMRITRNTALDFLRKKDMKHEIQTDDLYVYESKGNVDGDKILEASEVRDQVGKLKPEHEQVIDAVYFLGHTHTEAAKKLDIPLGTLKTRIRLALQELKKTFAT